MQNLTAAKSLRIRYIVGLTAIALLVTASFLSMQRVISDQRNFSGLINLAGHQSGLSNRIAFFSSQMATTEDEEEFSIARSQVGRTIHKMETAHEILLHGSEQKGIPRITNERLTIIFHDPMVGLDLALRRYLQRARSVYNSPPEELHPGYIDYVYLINYGPHVLEPLLDSVVEEYERIGNQAIHKIEKLELIIWIASLITLMLEAFLIFRPLEQRIKKSILKLEQNLIDIERTGERLTDAQRLAQIGDWEWNIAEDSMHWSEEMYRIFGLDPLLHQPSIEDFFQHCHPEDYQTLLDNIDTSIEAGYENAFDNRIFTADSMEKLIHYQSLARRDNEGKIALICGTIQDITDRDRALKQIKLERNRAQQYLDVAGVMLVALDRKGRVNMINKAGSKLLSMKETEILGEHWIDRFVTVDDQNITKQTYKNLLNGDVTYIHNLENHVVTANGDRRLIAWKITLIHDMNREITGVLSSGEDITESRMLAKALDKEKNFLQHIIDGVRDPIMVIGSDLEVLRLNRSAIESADELGIDNISLTIKHLSENSKIEPINHDCLIQLKDILNNGASHKIMHHCQSMSGEQRTYEVIASPLTDNQQQVIGVIEASRDISDHLDLLKELKESQLNYAYLAHHDALTGLPNRVLFNDRLEQAILVAKRNEKKLAVLFIDLDGFKHINDSFDHSFGDEVLKSVALRLKNLVREDDTIARMGGDEFIIILNGISHSQDAGIVAQKILELFIDPFNIQDQTVFLGASIGISIYPKHGNNIEDLVKKADTAMYRAKDEGRKTFQYYTDGMTAKAFERILLETNLRQALDNNQLFLRYQPQFNLETGEIKGMEALIRWQHPDMGEVSPSKFIQLAEESGLIVPMGEWVLQKAIRQMKVWIDRALVPDDALICVNISTKQFDRNNLIDQVKRILREFELPAVNLELEITESTMMRSPKTTRHILQQLRDLGVKVAIDDFGTGYSSLSHLKKLPLTKVKIDRSFLSDIPYDCENMEITKAIITLGKSLSLEVLAEGIESEHQQDFLISEGCNLGQGYLYAHPMTVSDLDEFIQGYKHLLPKLEQDTVA
ncbi:MAG: EAL domain-containing protein [Candidatus Thiodiazotropha sp. (ex. Lucinisca nassula)]|nr:EAL domain-containing protein [Candidatus Thiodiazotropha sp. (ex. Lucinisca nassula)]